MKKNHSEDSNFLKKSPDKLKYIFCFNFVNENSRLEKAKEDRFIFFVTFVEFF